MALSDQARDITRKCFEVGFGVLTVFSLAYFSKDKDFHALVDDTLLGLLVVVATAFILEPIEQKRVTRDLRAC